VLVVGLLWLLACSGKPPLRVHHDHGEVVIDVATLGEYRTSISRLRLTDIESQSVIWEFAQKTGEPQIVTVSVRPGPNSATPPEGISGKYELLVPRDGGSFTLVAGRRYRVEVWGTSSNPAVATFVM